MQSVRTRDRAAGAAETARTLVLRWSISTPAAVALGLASGSDPVALEVSVELTGECGGLRVGEVRAALHAGTRVREMEIEPTGAGACITDAETGLTHVDIPGVMHASMRMNEPGVGAQVLFARTTLLAKVGLAGGRYELESSSLR